MAGLCAENEATVKQALALDKSKQTQATAVLAAAICGNGKLALPMALELSKKYPEDTLIQGLYQPLAKAFVALAAGRPQEAVDAAEPAKSWDAIYPGSYVQGLAYLQLHDAGHALSAFQAATQIRRRQSDLTGCPSMRKRNWAWRARTPWAATRPTPRRPTRLFSPPGKMRMPTCPCWWRPRRNTLPCRRQQRMASH